MAERVDASNTGRRRTSRELQRSEERFRLLVDSVLDYAIFMLDRSGIVESWNAGAQRLKGYAAEEILGRHYSTFYTPESRADGLPDRLLATALEEGRVESTGWRVRKDGTRFWADVVITALFEDGSHTGFAKVTRDRTEAHFVEQARERTIEEQREVVARLEQLDQWRREFIGSILHDLQTPVTAIDGFSVLLRDGLVPPEERHEALESVLSNARSLQQLIDNLRAYNVLTEGYEEIDPGPVDLDALVRRLLADMAPLLGAREVDVDIGDVEVDADEHGLERILRNLLTNVARHTPATAPVHLRAHVEPDRVVIEVQDEGAGIPADLLPSVFDRFQSGGHGGTGLGLAIAKQYVELHGGTISVDSAEGEGATFRFTLPR